MQEGCSLNEKSMKSGLSNDVVWIRGVYSLDEMTMQCGWKEIEI